MFIEVRLEPKPKAKTLALLASEPIPDYETLFVAPTNELPEVHHVLIELLQGTAGNKLVTEDIYERVSSVCRAAISEHSLCFGSGKNKTGLLTAEPYQNLIKATSVAEEANVLYADIQTGKIYLHPF